jgi:hypothetical protein
MQLGLNDLTQHGFRVTTRSPRIVGSGRRPTPGEGPTMRIDDGSSKTLHGSPVRPGT